MPVVPYQRRSYGGGADPAQLVQPIGATDLFFTINDTTGWVQEDGSPLGTSGNFTVIIDRGSDTVEKINCSAVNLSSGLVTVVTGGRGYDGTTPQAHSPGTTPSGVQTTWSSFEADEANQAVTYVLGSAGGTRTPGKAMTLDGAGKPLWATVSGLQSVSMFGVGAAAYGTPPPRLTGAFLLQFDLLAPTFVSGFYGPYNFPQAFPNGTAGVIPSVINASPDIEVQIQWYAAGPASVELTALVNGARFSGALQLFILMIGF